jgi:predicted nuclease with RNAse H fold
MWVAGVDISERRGQTVALLDGQRMAVEIVQVPAAADAARLVQVRGAAMVAVDSPLRPSHHLLREVGTVRSAYGVPTAYRGGRLIYAKYRVCDYELYRRNIPLYQVAADESAAAPWMRLGFELARLLTGAGYRVPAGHHDYEATLLEVFPHAAFVTLIGAIPAKKSGPRGSEGRAQRRALLAAQGVFVPGESSHDDLDAAVAALTALRWREGRGCAVGHPEEGLIVLPVPCADLRTRYERLQDGTERR